MTSDQQTPPALPDMPAPRPGVLARMAEHALRRPRMIVTAAIALALLAAIFAAPLTDSLRGGGYQDPSSESARAATVLRDNFQLSDMPLVLSC